MATTACELKWLSYLFRDFQLELQLPIQLHYDNKAAIAIAANPINHERTKHIDIDCHIIREHVEKGFIITPHTYSISQLADSLTRAVNHSQLINSLSKFGIVNQFLT